MRTMRHPDEFADVESYSQPYTPDVRPEIPWQQRMRPSPMARRWERFARFVRRVPLPWRVALAFVALVVMSNAWLDGMHTNLVTDGNVWGAVKQLEACERQGTSPDVLIIGSSRAQAGIAPPIIAAQFDNAFGRRTIICDLAVTTSVPMQDYYLLRKLLRDGIHPKFIIYATADFAFNSPAIQPQEPVRDNMDYLATLADLPNIMQMPVADTRQPAVNGAPWLLDFVASRLFRVYADRKGFQIALCRWKPDFGPCPDILAGTVLDHTRYIYPVDPAQGWYPLPEATAVSLQNSANQYRVWLAHYQVAPDALAYLDQTVQLARKQGIGLILLNTPILPQHLAFFPQVSDYATYVDTLHRFAEAHGVPFYDEGLGFDDNLADFADTNHLNYWGAIHFTGWLTKQILIPEFRHQVLTRPKSV